MKAQLDIFIKILHLDLIPSMGTDWENLKLELGLCHGEEGEETGLALDKPDKVVLGHLQLEIEDAHCVGRAVNERPESTQ